jgi:hypothetical protein
MAKANAKPSLDVMVKDYFGRRSENGVEGLRLLVTCIERTARYRDWDALSRFITMAMKTESAKARVVKIVRAAFGDKLIYKANAKHDTGGTIVLGWDGAFPLAQSNSWGIVRGAVDAGKTWYDREFLKELPGPTPKVKTVDATAVEKSAKHLIKYLQEREAEGFVVGELLAKVQDGLKAARAQSTPIAAVTKKVVNGADVFEVPH